MRCENCILPFTTRDAHTKPFIPCVSRAPGLFYNEPGKAPHIIGHMTILFANYKNEPGSFG